MQALAHNGLLKRFDYLSTVSGGGYIGSAITWLVSDRAGDGDKARNGANKAATGPRFGLGKDDFPFGCDVPAPDAPRCDSSDQRNMLTYLRQHGNYLALISCNLASPGHKQTIAFMVVPIAPQYRKSRGAGSAALNPLTAGWKRPRHTRFRTFGQISDRLDQGYLKLAEKKAPGTGLFLCCL
jgi:hypothetical protein